MLVIKGSSRRDLEQAGNLVLSKISTRSIENNIKISLDKTQTLTFGNPTRLRRPPIFKLQNTNLKDVNQLMYLGVLLDKSLSFLQHIKQKRLEVQTIVQSLYKFTSLSGRLCPNFLKIWYFSILQRKLAYACSVWFPRMVVSRLSPFTFRSEISNVADDKGLLQDFDSSFTSPNGPAPFGPPTFLGDGVLASGQIGHFNRRSLRFNLLF